MQHFRNRAKSLILRFINGRNPAKSVDKAIKMALSHLKKHDYALYEFSMDYLGFSNERAVPPICKRNMMLKLSFHYHCSLATIYKWREKMFDMLLLALVQVGEVKPFVS